MNRPLLIAAFALLLPAIPLWAQHGGGGSHASGGGSHGGFSSHGSFGGGHAFSGSHSGSGFAGHSFSRPSFNRPFNRGSSLHGPLASRGRSGVGLRLRTYGYGYRNHCWGYGCGWGYGYPYLGGGVDPYWWWDSDSQGDPNQQYGDYDNGLANQMNEQGIPLRPPDSGDQNYSARSATPQRQPERTEAVTPTVLVFRDQHREEVQNYAIVGETLWTFAPQKTHKIPLDDLDIPATQKANDERGVDFRLPRTGEGQ